MTQVLTQTAIEETIYLIQETNVIRTGLLLYYDPIRMSAFSGSILSGMNADVRTLTEDDPDAATLPTGINVSEFTLTISDVTIS